MTFMSRIIEALNDVSSFFHKTYLEVYSWVYPFWLAAGFFYQLSLIFNRLAGYFYDFNIWVDSVAVQVAKILSWDTIKGYIKSWLPALEAAVSWFSNAVTNVTSIISNWWSATSVTVQGWISAATQGLAELKVAWDQFTKVTFVNLSNLVNLVKSQWDYFTGTTLPSLVSFSSLTTWWNSRLIDVQGLMDSAFTLRQSYWDGWQDWRDKVAEFFTDPLGWLESKFTDWFLGPE